MDNESEVQVVEQNDNTEVEVQETETVVKEKPMESPEAKLARLQREVKRAKQKLGIEETEEVEIKRKPFSLGYAEKAYLNANGVKGKDEYDLVAEMVSNTGKDIEELLENKYFQSELKDLRSTRESKNASDATSGSRTGQSSAKDTVDYWVAKGSLPPSYMVQLRRDVVNAKIKRETGGSKFTQNPTIS